MMGFYDDVRVYGEQIGIASPAPAPTAAPTAAAKATSAPQSTAAPKPTEAAFRPPNGSVIFMVPPMGDGKISVDFVNPRTDKDVVFLLVKDGDNDPLLMLYVRAGGKFTMNGFPAGKYDVYMQQGTRWDVEAEEFTDGENYMLTNGITLPWPDAPGPRVVGGMTFNGGPLWTKLD